MTLQLTPQLNPACRLPAESKPDVAAGAAPEDSLLRFAMRVDATLTGAIGFVIAALANPLAAWTGATPTEEYLLGAAFVGCGLVVFVLAAAPDLRRVGIGMAATNAVCTLATLTVVITGGLPLTAAGVAATLAVAGYTGAFAALQYLGVRRLA